MNSGLTHEAVSPPQPVNFMPSTAELTPTVRHALTTELVVDSWANIQPGQFVLISGDYFHRELLQAIAERCRKKGCQVELLYLNDPADIEYASNLSLGIDTLLKLARREVDIAARFLYDDCAFIRMVGVDRSSRNGLSDEVLERLEKLEDARNTALQLVGSAVRAGTVNRCVFPGVTPGWANSVFPECPEHAQVELIKIIDKALFLDQPNPVEAFTRLSDALDRRCAILNKIKYDAIRFVGPDTDIKIGLGPNCTWLGSKKVSTRGIEFHPNVPMGEIFTSPDPMNVTGHVKITVPTSPDGKTLSGLILHFKDGVVVDVAGSDEKSIKGFWAWVDKNAKGDEYLRKLILRLGEVALVGEDAPLAGMTRQFFQILVDEKIEPHIALGAAYALCLAQVARGEINQLLERIAKAAEAQRQVLRRELAKLCEQLAINPIDTPVHHDMMIGGANVNVYGIKDGIEEPILTGRVWADKFK